MNNNTRKNKKTKSKKVTFRNNRNIYNIPRGNENIQARKSIKNITPLTQENRNELYSHKLSTRNENKIRRRLTKQYLKEKRKYHLNNTNKNLIEEAVEREIGSFW